LYYLFLTVFNSRKLGRDVQSNTTLQSDCDSLCYNQV